MSRADQFRYEPPEQKEITVDGPQGPKTVLIQKVSALEVMRAGESPIMFGLSGDANASKMSAKDTINFMLMTVQIAMVDPKLWKEYDRDPAATPPGRVHWKALGDEYLQAIFAECMDFSGIGTAAEVMEATRNFRGDGPSDPDREGGDAVRGDAESVDAATP